MSLLARRARRAAMTKKAAAPPLGVELAIPAHFRCPISLDLMRDPVTTPAGITYDRESIEAWLEAGRATCPVTQAPLRHEDLVPNHAIRRVIQDWCVANRSRGVERIPTPKIPVTPVQASELLFDLADSARRLPARSRAFLPNILENQVEVLYLFSIMDKSNVKKEIDDPHGPPPRKGKLKFTPKVPPKKPAKVVPKTEPEDSKDEVVNKELSMKLKASMITDPGARKKAKAEDKSNIQTQVAFGQGSSSHVRSFPTLKISKSDESDVKQEPYAEPWDYDADYPVTLPLRRPYSGDPEILDEEEFGESSASRAQDAELTAAEELGLMGYLDTPQFLFFQMPSSLPLPQQPQSVADSNKGPEENADPASTSTKERQQGTMSSSVHGTKLKDLPGGLVGKILVYKSGKVKMKIGDALYNVSAGSNCMFVQEAAAVNTREKHCCTLGEISKRAVVTPDIEYLLGSVGKMDE